MAPASDPAIAAREVVIAQLQSLSRRGPVNAGATVVNALLVFVLLVRSAPLAGLATWTGLQVLGGAWLFWRSRRLRHKPRGSPRGVRMATLTGIAAGLLLGAVAPLCSEATLFQRFVVFLTVAAMASGASTTLAVVPGAAYGYVLGALLPVAAFWLLQGDLGHSVLAALAGSLTLFLLHNASVVHQSFLESLRQRHETEQLRQRFQEEQEEWLDLSRGTDAFALLDEQGGLLLCNVRFEALVRPFVPVRGARYQDLLESQSGPLRLDDEPVSKAAWMAARMHLHEAGGELVEETAEGSTLRVTSNALASGRRALLIVDVTALKRAERALREGEAAMARSQRAEMVGTLAAGVAHDFNNLLMAIRGAARLLQNQVESAEGRELLSDIETSVERGSRLTRQLLAAGKRQLLKPIPFDLNQVIQGCVSLVRRSVPASIRFELSLDEALRPALADPGQIEQVLINLVFNARDAMPSGGVLRVRTQNLDSDYVEVIVEDTGTGVSPAIADRVFEPFFTTKPNHAGSGLGLSVAQGIVKQSGGSMAVHNGVEGGARFVFTLPTGSGVDGLQPPTDNLRESPRRLLRILVVDDEPMVRKITVRMLKAWGHEVLEASEGTEAIALFEAEPGRIQVLLSDVVMPGLSGPELAKAARASHPNLCVVYMTGYDAGALEADDAAVVIQKPFAPEALSAAIDAATRACRTPEPVPTES